MYLRFQTTNTLIKKKYFFYRIVQQNSPNLIVTAELDMYTVEMSLWWFDGDTEKTSINWKLPHDIEHGVHNPLIHMHDSYFVVATNRHLFVGKRNDTNINCIWNKALTDSGRCRVITDRYLFM
jgi:hypothetical protein